MRTNISFAAVGLVIGLTIGFFAANSLNRGASTPQRTTAALPSPAEKQIDNVIVRDQSAGSARPEITGALEKAKNEPDNFEAQVEAGDLYLKIQNFPKAVEFYEAAYRVDHTNHSLIVKLGNSYFDSNDFEKAGKWYAMALAEKPGDFGVRTDFGITFMQRGDLERAIREFETAETSNPKHEPTLFNLAVALNQKGDVDGANKVVEKLESVNPKSELLSRLKQIVQ